MQNPPDKARVVRVGGKEGLWLQIGALRFLMRSLISKKRNGPQRIPPRAAKTMATNLYSESEKMKVERTRMKITSAITP